jgi:hypothetical protein
MYSEVFGIDLNTEDDYIEVKQGTVGVVEVGEFCGLPITTIKLHENYPTCAYPADSYILLTLGSKIIQ